jgi:biopolymer transport protein ExbB/TolQ
MDMSSGGVAFALSHATMEGKITIAVLLVFSLVSWTVIINKFRQLHKAEQDLSGPLRKGQRSAGDLQQGPAHATARVPHV